MISKKWRAVAAASILATTLAACGSNDSEPSDSGTAASGVPLKFLTATAGPAELDSVKKAVAAWAKANNKPTPEVINSGKLEVETAQGFASGKPADVFRMAPGDLANYVPKGFIYPYGDKVPELAQASYENLNKLYTYDGKLTCVAKDVSPLALVINTTYWEAAGLTDADVPKTWDELTAVATKLTKGKAQTGLVTDGSWDWASVFMKQAGGGRVVSEDNKQVIVNSPENLTGLEYLKKNLNSGVFKYAKEVGEDWGGGALITGKAAMTIQGSWIIGAIEKDAASLKYKAVELPAGPAGKGSVAFSNCWGIAEDSKNKDDAVSLVKFMNSKEQQLANARISGIFPADKAAAQEWAKEKPEFAAWAVAGEYSNTVPTAKGVAPALTEFTKRLETLKTSDPAKILADTQKDLEGIVGKG
ncbi:MAG: ABC transporter substrate-binding protein [Actinomycetota bacterium]